MRIKWKDFHGGMVRNERWERIGRGRALAMLQRTNPEKYQEYIFDLSIGREIETKTFTLKEG